MDVILSPPESEGRTPPPDPLDEMFDFLIEENGTIPTIYAHHTEQDMNLALRQPWCSIGSDGYAAAIDGPLRRGHGGIPAASAPSPASWASTPARAPSRWRTPSAR